MAWVNGKSGTYNISTNNSAISGYVYWSERYDIANNKSEVSQIAYLHRTNIYDGNTWFENGTVTRTAFFGSETVPTTVVTSMTIKGNTSANGGEYLQVYSAVKEIAHNADGTKSITLGFSMSNNVGGIAGNSFTVPKTTAAVTLTAIPRATTPTLSAATVTMGSTINITLSPADSTFKHKIRYEFGSLASQIEGIKSNGTQITAYFLPGGTYTFTPPVELANQIPSANSGTAKLIIYTYRHDDTHVGTESVNITLNVSNYSPSVASPALTYNNTLNGLCVQGKSKVKVEISASSLYGATIKSYSSTVDGKTYTGSSFTSAVLGSGSKTVSVTVTDTRGKTATVSSAAFTVYEYSAPSITDFTLARRADGTTVDATVKGSIKPVNGKNTDNGKVIVSLPGKDPIEIKATSGTINATATFTGVSTDVTLTGTAKLQDSYTSVTRTYVLPTVAVTMDFLYTGNGIAMGKVAETQNLLDVAWAIKTGQPAKSLANFSFRGTNPITKASEDTLDFWAAQGNLATAFFTDSTVDMTKPSTWGYVLNIGANPGTKEFHQLWLEQSNGSIHHRGANASAINPWRKLLDTVNCPDYVIERGTSDGWEYTKWNSGKMELFGEKSLSFPEGAKQGDFPLYRSIVALNLSGLLTKIMSGTCSVQINGMVPQVCRHSSNLATAEIVIVTSRTFAAFTMTAPIYIIGKWK